MPGDANLTVRIPADLKNMVEREAAKQDRSKAYIIIKAIRSYLERKEEK